MQKALTLWHERMLRSDNITCITVMLDLPGLPFSDCIVKKKREKLTSSMSSCENDFFSIGEKKKVFLLLATASICSDDTVDMDYLSPTTSTTVVTSQRTKPVLERNEHILIPISNGPTPVRVSLFFFLL